MHTTVVAYDGSEPSAAALSYATSRAQPNARLVVAHVAEVPVSFLETPYYEPAVTRARERAAALLSELEPVSPDDVAVETAVLSGPPAQAVVELAREVDADEIAVGSRGFGALWGAALGSTSHALLNESHLPVVVVTRRALGRDSRRAGGERHAPGAVVVGYDGSANGRAALEYAQRRAAGGTRLVAVYAYHPPPGWLGKPYYQRALDDHQQRGREILRELSAEVGEDVETELLEGPAAPALVRAAHANRADEVVVGSRGLGRFRAALGSVSHELLLEADLPVVVVPSETGA